MNKYYMVLNILLQEDIHLIISIKRLLKQLATDVT